MNFKRMFPIKNGFGMIFLDLLFIIGTIILLTIIIFQNWENFQILIASLKLAFK